MVVYRRTLQRRKRGNIAMRIMFIKPHLETDAVWDPIRTSTYLGIWFMASLLKSLGHEVRYLDEIVRNNGLARQTLFQRTLAGDKLTESPMDSTFAEFHESKMEDFNQLSPQKFVRKYTAFQDNGSITRIIVRTGNDIKDTLQKVARFQPNIVGIPLISTANYLPATRLGKVIKDAFPEIKLIFGGQHITAEYRAFLAENPWVDQVVVGDAISVIANIISGEITDRVVMGGSQAMNQFSLLDPSIISNCGYPSEPTHAFTSSGRKAVDFMFSKGCPGHCEFCVAGSQGGCLTATTTEAIERQLLLFRKHGIEELIIQDDAFLANEAHLFEMLRLMKKHGFYWQNNGGLDFAMLSDEITEQFVNYNRMGNGRITALYIPFNPRPWNKSESAAGSMISKYDRSFRNLMKLREAEIYVFTSEIIGTPDQTIETLESDIELHRSMIQDGHLDAVLTLTATLLPGTKWFKENRQMIVNERDFPGYSLFTTHHHTSHIPNPRTIEEFTIRRGQKLNEVQKTHQWGSAFPNC